MNKTQAAQMLLEATRGGEETEDCVSLARHPLRAPVIAYALKPVPDTDSDPLLVVDALLMAAGIILEWATEFCKLASDRSITLDRVNKELGACDADGPF